MASTNTNSLLLPAIPANANSKRGCWNTQIQSTNDGKHVVSVEHKGSLKSGDRCQVVRAVNVKQQQVQVATRTGNAGQNVKSPQNTTFTPDILINHQSLFSDVYKKEAFEGQIQIHPAEEWFSDRKAYTSENIDIRVYYYQVDTTHNQQRSEIETFISSLKGFPSCIHFIPSDPEKSLNGYLVFYRPNYHKNNSLYTAPKMLSGGFFEKLTKTQESATFTITINNKKMTYTRIVHKGAHGAKFVKFNGTFQRLSTLRRQ